MATARWSDGFACAEALRANEPAAFELLTTTPLPFRYVAPDTDVQFTSEMIKLGADGELFEIRHSNALLAPLRVAPDKMIDTYRAMQAFVKLLRDPLFVLQTRLQPGDVMTFDNYRVLHGRTGSIQ